MGSKVFVIGLDGGTFDLIAPWAEAGYLPTLKKLITGGVSGDLRSTYPPLTGPAWSSFMTGKLPASHGVLEFFRRREGSYRQVLNTRFDIQGKSIWRRLSDAGKRVGVIGIPLTYPPEPVNGFLITGLLTPSGCRDFTYPPELLAELESRFGTYQVRHDEKYRRSNPQPFLREQKEILENNTQVAEYLMEQKPWDFFMVHFLGTDRMQHEFWHLLDPTHPDHDPVERAQLGNVVLDFFVALDACIARLLEKAGDAAVLLMSDHGFGPIHRFLNVNTWLLQQKLLRLKNTPGTWLRYILFRLGFNYSVSAHWVLRLGIGKSAVQLGRGRREDLQRRLFLSLDDVDWSSSKVYSIGNFGQLFVNLRGREPQGIVNPGEAYARLLEELKERLASLVDPETGRPMISEIYERDQLFNGPYADQAPDLFFLTENMQYKAMGLSDFSSPRVFEPVYGTTGHHRMNGLLIGYHPGTFEAGKAVYGAGIEDLAPTILYMMGLPIPPSMDGRVLVEAFTQDFLQEHPVDEAQDEEAEFRKDRQVLSDEEEMELADRLRSLGYIN